MRTLRSVASVFVMSALIVSCSDQPASPAVDGPQFAGMGPLIHHASLGGADVCEAFGLPTGCDANLSLVANQFADGTVMGEWSDAFGFASDGAWGGVHVKVDCLAIHDNQAVVGGVITKFDLDPARLGQRAITTVVDNGTSANDLADQLSFSFLYLDLLPNGPPPGLSDCTIDPAFFYSNCPFLGGNCLFDLANGQVKVW